MDKYSEAKLHPDQKRNNLNTLWIIYIPVKVWIPTLNRQCQWTRSVCAREKHTMNNYFNQLSLSRDVMITMTT